MLLHRVLHNLSQGPFAKPVLRKAPLNLCRAISWLNGPFIAIALFIKMHSFISIVGVVLNGKENYREWYRKIKSTMIFNNFWKDICDATPTNEKDELEAQLKISRLTIPTINKECAIWKEKDHKAYALIAATISEEVSRHIVSINDSYSALKRLNNLYDTWL